MNPIWQISQSVLFQAIHLHDSIISPETIMKMESRLNNSNGRVVPSGFSEEEGTWNLNNWLVRWKMWGIVTSRKYKDLTQAERQTRVRCLHSLIGEKTEDTTGIPLSTRYVFVTESFLNIYGRITNYGVYVIHERRLIHKTLAFSLRILVFLFAKDLRSSWFLLSDQIAPDDFHSPRERFPRDQLSFRPSNKILVGKF